MTSFNAAPKFSRQVLLLTTGIFLLAATEGAVAEGHSHDHGGNSDQGMPSENSDHGNRDGMKTHNSYQDGGKHAGHHKDKDGSNHAELNKDNAEGKHHHKDKGGDEHAALNKDKAEGKHHHKDKGEDKYASHKKGSAKPSARRTTRTETSVRVRITTKILAPARKTTALLRRVASASRTRFIRSSRQIPAPPPAARRAQLAYPMA